MLWLVMVLIIRFVRLGKLKIVLMMIVLFIRYDSDSVIVLMIGLIVLGMMWVRMMW